MSVKVILRSPESIRLFMDKYFEGKEFKLNVAGEVTLEQEKTDIAVDVFKLLLEENLVSTEHVEFLNITPSLATMENEVQELSEEKGNHGASIEKESKTKNTKEMVFEFLCKISPEKATTTEISQNLQIAYQSVSAALRKLYKEGKVDESKKRYFQKLTSSEIVEKISRSSESEDTKDSNNKETPSTTIEGKDVEVTDEEEKYPECTPIEKAKTMLEAFSNEKYTDVLCYIFFKRKGNFEVEKIRATLGHREAESIATVITTLASKGIISFNEKLPPEGRYEIEPIWRIYANLIRNVEPMEEGALRTAVELGDKEFQKIMKQSLEYGILERTDIKRVIRYAVKKLA